MAAAIQTGIDAAPALGHAKAHGFYRITIRNYYWLSLLTVLVQTRRSVEAIQSVLEQI